MSGFGWMLKYLYRKGIIEDPKEHIQSLSTPITLFLKREINLKNFDLFSGANGPMLFFLQENPPDNFNHIVNYYISGLVNSASYDNYGIKWLSAGYKNGVTYEKNVLNFGIPHGMAGILLLLIQLDRFDDFQIKKIINQVVTSMVSRLNLDDKEHQIPNMIFEDGSISDSKVMGWCYGVLSVGYALLKAAIMINDDITRLLSIKILKQSLSFNLQYDGSENKYSLCHGSTSIAYMYFKIFTLINDPEFLSKSFEWVNICLRNLPADNNEESLIKQINFNYKNSLMYGLPGSLISLISIVEHEECSWDNLLLL
jgi:hypothetical protein